MSTISSRLLLLLLGLSTTAAAQQVPQLGRSSVKEVINAMSLPEKINMVMGTGMNFPGLPESMRGPVVGQTEDRVPGAAGTTYAIPRLGIPSIVLADGPAGLRITPRRKDDSLRTYYCTAFPIATLLASSWDTALVQRVGTAMGNEVKEYGVDVFLAPALNIHRNPLGGRNFEYYSEDPYVTGMMTKAMVRGVEAQGVGTSIKHYAANNNEVNRNTINVKAGERALREIYLKGFEMTVRETQPWTVMSSYNKINGTYTSESYDLLTTILRTEWGYKGLVMTDWFGGTNATAQMKAGNDLLMPGTASQQKALLEAVQNGQLDVSVIDQNVERILQLVLRSPAFKGYKFSNAPDLKAHAAVARSAAAEGMVLLENRSALPLPATANKLAVFGNATYDMITGGTGSGDVNEAYTVSLTQGLRAKGYSISEEFQQRYETSIASAKAARPKQANPFLLPPPIEEIVISTEDIQALANQNDAALITIGRNSGEFADRSLEGDFYLTLREKDLIRNVAQAFRAQGKKVTVILNIGGVVETASWKDSVDAVLLAWQPGQEAGHAIADVLTGAVNPSGKLATTFPVKYDDVASSKNFPSAAQNPSEVVYEEGIYVGYRYADKAGVAPAYPFGYGLSFTTFTYGPVKATVSGNKVQVSMEVTNSGKVAGKEAVQLYVSAPGSIDKPLRELKAFGKTRLLKPGEKQVLQFVMDVNSLASFHTNRSAWITDAGTYTVFAGSSSRDLRSEARFTLPKEIVRKVNPVLKPEGPLQEMRLANAN
jgi:beta-glucosidase